MLFGIFLNVPPDRHLNLAILCFLALGKFGGCGWVIQLRLAIRKVNPSALSPIGGGFSRYSLRRHHHAGFHPSEHALVVDKLLIAENAGLGTGVGSERLRDFGFRLARARQELVT